MTERFKLPVIGWREWVALPELNVPLVECKVDTGARTSALHAFYLEPFEENGIQRVRFGLHPVQGDTDREIHCIADVHDERVVSDSGGHKESRYVIRTPVVLGNDIWPIEITLTNRDTMRFRMLLGRTAMSNNFIVDPALSRQMGKPSIHPERQLAGGLLHDEEEE